MKDLDRFIKVMTYGDFDHPPLLGEGPWAETVARWEREGLAKGTSWDRYFGVRTFNIAGHGFSETLYPGFKETVIEETDAHRIFINHNGVKVRDLKGSMSMPEWLEFPIRDRATFEAVLAEQFQPDFAARFPANFDALVRGWNAPDFDALLLPPAGNYFSTLHNLAGTETVSLLYYDCPDLIHRMNETICEMCCRFAERMLPSTPNVFCMGSGEDLAFKNGPFFSPAMFEEFYAPYYRRVMETAHRHGVRHCWFDTDGNFDALARPLLDVGITIFMPMEVAAGMDPVVMRRKYGKALRMIGGVDKRIVAAGKDAIAREMERLFPLMCEGGFIPKIDHSISSDISWDNFRYYMETLLQLHARCAHRT
jgi:hypothetical protein